MENQDSRGLVGSRQQSKDTIEKERKALAESEAALREENRQATDKRRYQVGALADEAGLLAWSNAEIATLFARVVTLRAQSADLLATLLAEPVPPAKARENGVAETPSRVSAAH